ncbi:CRISPR-associated helicase Cas3' [Buchananella hordeovulneris]|uniref:CRISPR-associated helicase Cas3' n=1 Tax=Buchananella hordeovulneris TaxID=52770 RepID=UPI000F5EB8FE|nr:CRISPR-associated helicase Cas3' [Buchananella hordeovulneris]RRD42866.1 CRISPR-associated helicase Cas3' [Buchananella hordeovulneris]
MQIRRTLSPAAMSVWGKSMPRDGSAITHWLPLWLHLEDTAAVAGRLVDAYGPSLEAAARRQFGDDDPLGHLRAVMQFLGAVHDVGKVSPGFSHQVGELYDRCSEAGLPKSQRIPVPPPTHGVVGQLAVEEEARKWQWKNPKALASVVGGHHGIPASSNRLQRERGALKRPGGAYGGPKWAQVRSELINRAAALPEVAPRLAGWKELEWSIPFLVLAEGLLIMADWIASADEFFPLLGVRSDGARFLVPEMHAERVEAGWRTFDLPVGWRPRDTGRDASELLAARFDLPADAQPRPMQRAALQAARDMELPGLLVIEDLMGAGKTEAAFLAAEVLAARTGRQGCLVALPTQATADAMFKRLLTWLGSLDDESSVQGEAQRFPTQLLHGRSNFNEDLRQLRRASLLGSERAFRGPELNTGTPDIGRDDGQPHGAEIASWFTGRKKSILADFAVSTIDHVLFAALCSKHLALRHLGLAKKVIVIDEVHASDWYMSHFLERALEWLGAYGVPVVLLSATLNDDVRHGLLAAYRRGLGAEEEANTPGLLETGYPLLSAATATGVFGQAVEQARPSVAARMELTAADPDLVPLLDELLVDGGCVLVVRNTVRRAQETYRELRAHFGAEVTLLHSRFLLRDRQAAEKRLREQFGPPEKAQRPTRAIVVATQVVEQSLDIDFDYLVSDLAPLDVLLQRVGRVHRHARPHRPAKLSAPGVLVVNAPELVPEPKLEGGSCAVYGDYLLLRTAQALRERATGGVLTVTLPDDIASCMTAVFSRAEGTVEAWPEELQAAQEKLAKLRHEQSAEAYQFLLGGPRNTLPLPSLENWLPLVTNPNDEGGREKLMQGRVRLGDDSFEVLVVDETDEGNWRLVDSAGPGRGEVLPTDQVPDFALLQKLAASVVRLPKSLTIGKLGDELIEKLECNFCPAWQSSPLLRGQLILLLKNEMAELGKKKVHYDCAIGLEEIEDDLTC